MYFNPQSRVDLLSRLTRQDDSVVLGLEPLHSILLGQTVWETNLTNLLPSVSHVDTRSAQHYKEVHSVDTNARIVLDTKINMLLDSETKVSIVRKVFLPQLVLPNFEATLQDLFRLRSSHSAMDRNLLIPTDTKGTNCVAGFGEYRRLPGQRLQHLASSSEPVTRLTHTNVKAELSDSEIPHNILGLVLSGSFDDHFLL